MAAAGAGGGVAAAAPPRLFQRGDQQVGVEVSQYVPFVRGLAAGLLA